MPSSPVTSTRKRTTPGTDGTHVTVPTPVATVRCSWSCYGRDDVIVTTSRLRVLDPERELDRLSPTTIGPAG